MSLSLFIFHWN